MTRGWLLMTVIEPDLVLAVDDTGRQLFIDRFESKQLMYPMTTILLRAKGQLFTN